MFPSQSSYRHGPPSLGRVALVRASPTSTLLCVPPTPPSPSAAAPVPLARRSGSFERSDRTWRATCHDTDASSWPPRACIRERTARRTRYGTIRLAEPDLRGLVFGSPYTCPVCCRGKTGVSQVTWPSSSSAPRSTTPPGAPPPRPSWRWRRCCLQDRENPWAPGMCILRGCATRGSGRSRTYARSGPHCFKRHRGGHQRRCCHHRSKARYRPAGLGFGRTGLAPAGRHPNFTESSHTPGCVTFQLACSGKLPI